ncbi:MAG: 6-bladed beta-propeller [Candidatus Aminicenantes bacterium]|nr:6-bladed beta-propeller [Candidatus Aminicenantes bacterium]
MKRPFILAFLFMLLVPACRTQTDTVEKTSEEGVEVVLNHPQPYRVKGAPESLRLEQEMAIDTERDELAKKGVVDIWGFDVNSFGDIFIYQPPMSTGKFISKFDATGRFLTSFAPKGQGPGEIQWPIFHKISADDGLPVLDMITRKLLVFDKDGAVLRTMDVPLEIRGGSLLLQLPTGNYLYRKVKVDPVQEYPSLIMIYSLINREFRDIKELDRVEIPHPFGVAKIRIPVPLTIWGVTGDRIYMGNPENGYEIRVYDLDGNLLRKIRKEFVATPFPESKKLAILKALESPQLAPLKNKLVFPDSSPPFQHLFCDDEGRLYVMTYETGEKPGEYLFDIFTTEGIFFARTSCAAHLWADLYAPGSPTDSWVTAKNGRLYAVREKPNGYKELVVYRMKWK